MKLPNPKKSVYGTRTVCVPLKPADWSCWKKYVRANIRRGTSAALARALLLSGARAWLETSAAAKAAKAERA